MIYNEVLNALFVNLTGERYMPQEPNKVVKRVLKEIKRLQELGLADEVHFIDTYPSDDLFDTAERIQNHRGIVVHVRDHHRSARKPRNEKEMRNHFRIRQLEQLLGSRAVIRIRSEVPTCVDLYTAGELRDKKALIIAGLDEDSFLTALWARGEIYSGIRNDAAILDGPPSGKNKKGGLTGNGEYLARAHTFILATAATPQEVELARTQMLDAFIQLIGGGTAGKKYFAGITRNYKQLLAESKRLATDADRIGRIAVVDTVHAKPYCRTELHRLLEAGKASCIAVRTSKGIIANEARRRGFEPEQYAVHVTLSCQQELNLLDYTAGREVGVEHGIICNEGFILYCSAKNWTDVQVWLDERLNTPQPKPRRKKNVPRVTQSHSIQPNA